MSGAERRRHPRVVVDVPIRLLIGDVEHSGRLRDICRDAALVAASSALSVDTDLRLKMQLPGITELIELDGRVIRSLPTDSGQHEMAILFTTITPLAAIRIDFFVALQTDLKEAGGGGPAAH